MGREGLSYQWFFLALSFRKLYACICDHLACGFSQCVMTLCLGVSLGDTDVAAAWHWWMGPSSWQEGCGAAKSGDRMRSISLPKAAADGGASLPGRPMTWEEPFGSTAELPCTNAGDRPGLEWIRMQQRWLVEQTTIWWAGHCSFWRTDRQEQVPVGQGWASVTWSDRHNRLSPRYCLLHGGGCKSQVNLVLSETRKPQFLLLL